MRPFITTPTGTLPRGGPFPETVALKDLDRVVIHRRK